ncbi:SCO family protein [Sporosarcina sp. BI001-red]|uniref:SCO family protein n=1 Tax=Sporosarcina sp. BI001-red TaxID=2282866 RepID=UPI000E25544F|nr:SCO family protein [Sporosarcina sp. BI001-red]REB06470.1 SCO family protein [Sporosarcina sp. BI001-red]
MKAARLVPIMIVVIVFLSACSSPKQPIREISSFSFIDQQGDAFGFNQLEDTVWIADFIFTKCETVCPPMTSEMADLQKEFKKHNLDVQFVSFTVDPDVDTPETLKAYARQYTDDTSNWHFLTGYSPNEITRYAMENFQTIIQKPETSDQVIHGTNFYLIAKNGQLVSEFNYVDEDYVHDLLKTVKDYTK